MKSLPIYTFDSDHSVHFFNRESENLGLTNETKNRFIYELPATFSHTEIYSTPVSTFNHIFYFNKKVLLRMVESSIKTLT